MYKDMKKKEKEALEFGNAEEKYMKRSNLQN